jgi:hypothetical protein
MASAIAWFGIDATRRSSAGGQPLIENGPSQLPDP